MGCSLCRLCELAGLGSGDLSAQALSEPVPCQLADEAALTEMAKAEGYSDWGQLFVNRSGERTNWRALDKPTMDADHDHGL